MIEKLNLKNEKYLLDMVEQLKNETGEIIDIRVSETKLKTAFLFYNGNEYLGFIVCSTKDILTNEGNKKVAINEGMFVMDKNFAVAMSLVSKFENWAYDKNCDFVVSRVLGKFSNDYAYLTHTGYKTKNGEFYIKRLDKKNLPLNR